MKFYEHTYKPEFLNIISKHVKDRNFTDVYDINMSRKYSLDYITDVVLAISSSKYNKYKLPTDLAEYFHRSEYIRYTKTSLKDIIKSQQCETSQDNTFFNTYIVIGHDIPISIKELSVVID